MYTQTPLDNKKLDTLMVWLLIPAIRRAIQETAEAAVCQIEGFHPDIAYGESVAAAADEITAILCDYFAGLSYRNECGMYDAVTEDDLKRWLQAHYHAS